MVSNEIASLIQTEDRVTIVLNEPYRLAGFKMTEQDEMLLLAVFGKIAEEKLWKNTKSE